LTSAGTNFDVGGAGVPEKARIRQCLVRRKAA